MLHLETFAGEDDNIPGDEGQQFLVLPNSRVAIGQSGYLTAWDYLIGTTSDRCVSYVAIWRGNGSGYINIFSEELLPLDLNLGGRRFQYSPTGVKVLAGDVLGIYVKQDVYCNGHIVANNAVPPNSQLIYNGAARSIETHPHYLPRGQLTSISANVALKIYIASTFQISLLGS